MNIVLLEPEIPHNAGAIGRTCAVTGSRLHLIKPLGFSVSEKHLKRSGLDYWNELNVQYYENYEDFLEKTGMNDIFFATTKAERLYSDVHYNPDSYIMFGKESAGIPEDILIKNREKCIRIPMLPDKRSINLSVSAGIVLYEALRQNSFLNLLEKGELHHSKWEDH